jgi:exosortase D (VPLPA-CTERM-specific)
VRTAPLPAIALAAAAFVAVFAPIFARLVRNWWIDDNYSHGFLILPIAAYLAWERRARLAGTAARPSNVGLLVVAGSLVVLLLGVFGAEVFLARIAMLGVAAGVVLFVLGWRHLAILAFPLAFLLLMIPVPAILFNHVALPLQLLASRLGEVVLSLAGVPALREGNVITLAHAKLEVAEACSGIRSLVSLLALAIVCAYLTDRRTWVRVTLAVLAVPVAIVVNGLRVAGTGLLAQRFGIEAAEGFFHAFSGWLMFLAAFALLVALQRLLAAAIPNRARRSAPARDPDARSTLGASRHSLHTRLILFACCLLATAVVVRSEGRPEPTLSRRPLKQLPFLVGSWQGEPGPPLDGPTMEAVGVDDFVNRVYATAGLPPVALYIGYYKSQREGDTIHSPLNCLPGAGWEPVSRAQASVAVRETAGGPLRTINVNRLLIQKGTDRELVYYWYQSHGRVVANEYWGRMLLAIDAVRLNRTDGALVRIVAPATDDDGGAATTGERGATAFIDALFPLLREYVPQ